MTSDPADDYAVPRPATRPERPSAARPCHQPRPIHPTRDAVRYSRAGPGCDEDHAAQRGWTFFQARARSGGIRQPTGPGERGSATARRGPTTRRGPTKQVKVSHPGQCPRPIESQQSKKNMQTTQPTTTRLGARGLELKAVAREFYDDLGAVRPDDPHGDQPQLRQRPVLRVRGGGQAARAWRRNRRPCRRSSLPATAPNLQ